VYEDRKTVVEPQRHIPVLDEVDVAVVGGGPAGLTAAVAAGRRGAKVALVERYGYVGGMATGGHVILLDSMGDDRGFHVIHGLAQEMVDELEHLDAVVYPPKETWGSDDQKLVKKWRRWGAVSGGRHVRYSPVVNPEYFKVLGNRMLDAAGVTTWYHAWACSALMEEGAVRGVIVESKSGRLAITAGVTVDCTGDGDVFAFAGADFDQNHLPPGLVFRVGGVDTDRAESYIDENSEEFDNRMREMTSLGGIKGGILEQSVAPGGQYMYTTVGSVVWFNNSLPRADVLSLEDLSHTEKEVREQMLVTLDYFRKHIPGFENAYLVDTAPQLGTRASRRLVGEHVITREEMVGGASYSDTVATCSSVVDGRPHVNIPYRSLLPRKVDNLLVAGRCISTDAVTQSIIRIIPPCMVMGQAAGTAAAVAAGEGVRPRDVDTDRLRSALRDDGMYLED